MTFRVIVLILSKNEEKTIVTSLPKVCIFTETYYPEVGGGEVQAQSLAAGLADAGIPAIVLTRRTNASQKKVEQIGQATVFRLSPVGEKHWMKWGLIFTGLAALVHLRRHYDLVFVSGYRVIGIPAVLVKVLLGKRCILKADSNGEISGAFFKDGLSQLGMGTGSFLFKLFLLARNRLIRGADGFVAITSEIAAELAESKVSPNQIHNIPNFTETSRFHPLSSTEKQAIRTRLGFSPDDLLVIYTGRLVSYKGLPLLLKVWNSLSEKHMQVRLLLLGAGSLDIHNCELDLHRFVEMNGLEHRVTFMGVVENVHEYLQASDLFVLPSEKEAFSISLIEAMACGLAVIATTVGGAKDVLRDGENGLSIRAGDFDQLYNALDALLSDPDRRRALAAEAIRTINQHYSREVVLRAYMDLFQQVTFLPVGISALEETEKPI
jgi:glycosyltransferase involved in cell wall biosynthesis